MTITTITLWVPTGIRHINWLPDGTWTIRPVWYRRVETEQWKPSEEYEGMADGKDATARFWIKNELVHSIRKVWTGCSDDHIRQKLKEEGFELRWFDSLEYSAPSSGIWDININSSIMEKLYASTTEAGL